MATAPVNGLAAKLAGFAAAIAMLAVIGGISMSGRWPVHNKLVREHPKGILSLPADKIARVEITRGDKAMTFERTAGGWTGTGATVAPAIAQHVDEAIHFLNVSPPIRTMLAGEYGPEKITEYGLDPPRMLISLRSRDGERRGVAFGEQTTAKNLQYVRILGRPDVYLLSRYVGVEWEVALDMAERATPAASGARPTTLLLPLSFDTVWAVEIVEGGQLTRFERDPAGAWFHHTGQHTHRFGFVHKADPKFAPLIAAQLADLERASVEAVVATHPDEAKLAEFGLEHPSAIMVLYNRDSSQPVARLELGNSAKDGFARYARVRETNEIVTVPRFAVAHIEKLLQLAGVRS